jgi:tRNA A37 methylthiotransferase MiaB
MKADSTQRPVRVGLISLGCAKNLVDGEIMLGTLLKDGLEITNDATKADVIIVNTCSFIDSAQQESVDTILESAELREAKRRGQGLVVAGCLTQRFREQLPALMPEVDAFMGIDQVAQVTQIVKQAMERRAAEVQSPRSKVQSPKERESEGRGQGAGGRNPKSETNLKGGKYQNRPGAHFGCVGQADVHSRLFDAAVSADAAAFRLRQNR